MLVRTVALPILVAADLGLVKVVRQKLVVGMGTGQTAATHMQGAVLHLVLLWTPFVLRAQSCFVQEEDATGSIAFSTAQLAAAAACSLRAVFPPEFQDDFAVYDFGFYLHQQGYEGGMPQVFQDKIAEVEQESPYFLLFGRELGAFPLGGRFWIELVVPKSTSYPCVTIDRVENIKSSLEIQLQEANEDWVARLTAGMDHVSQHVDKVYNCCTTGNQLQPWAPFPTLRVGIAYVFRLASRKNSFAIFHTTQ